MKRFFVRATAAVAFLATSVAGFARADDPIDPGPGAEAAATLDDGSQLWFVEMPSPPVADGGDIATIEQEQNDFRGAAGQTGLRYTERRSFKNLWNGLSIAVHPGDLGKLNRIPGVAALYPVVSLALPEEAGVNEPDLLTALSMTGADVAQNDLGLTGAGVKVGIIDTGMDYDHPDLGGDGVTRTNSGMFPTARVVTGYDFVGDAFDGGNTPVPDPYPDDCNGHGTHVSGIVGASGGARGVAPGVTFGMYRVFGCGGSTTADIMIAALERALEDGMKVVNMSIGNDGQWPQYPTAAASDRLVNKGVVVVASIGNRGTAGLYFTAAPGVGKKVIGVASFDNTHINLPAIRITPDGLAIGYSLAIGAPGPPIAGSFPMARTGTAASTSDACAPLPAGNLAGKVALIRRGACTSYAKCRNAELAGAIAVVLYNNAAGALNPTVVGSPPITIPVIGVTRAGGELINARLAAGPVTMTWGGTATTVNSTGGLISVFSTFGIGPDLVIKPDLGAPGGFIRSTWPLEAGGYANISGTSMSSPHVAGAVALLLQAHPNTPSNAVRDILLNSARPHPFSGTPSLVEPVQHQGGGMLDIAAAVRATTRIEPGKLSLGETEAGPVTRMLTITNNGAADMTYDLSNMGAVGTGPDTFFPTFNTRYATASFSQNPVTVPAGGSATVDVTLAPDPALADRSLFDGYLCIESEDGEQEHHVPYTGLKGDYQSIPSLVPTLQGFPWLAKLVGSTFVNQPAGASYTLTGSDFPFIIFHLDHPVSLLRFEAFDANTGQAWHRVFEQKWFRRSTLAGSSFSLGWDGITVHGNQVLTVPNGRYVMKLSVLKALGDAANPAHWEYWTSPTITLARPNLAVEGTWLSQDVVQPGDEVMVSASIRHTGTEGASGVVVEFFDNDVPFHSETFDLAANASRVVAAPWTVDQAPSHRLRVSVSQLESESDYGDNVVELDVTPGEVIVGVGGSSPKVLALAPAQPNPSSGGVAFRFSLPEPGPVSLEVFDLLGRRMRTWRWDGLAAGEHAVKWDGRTDGGARAPAGALLYRLTAMGKTLTQKAVWLP